ncbi:MAG: calcium-binding protein [Symploca sp. SIO1C4]|uniref:Calcium-binding protein n=1 Tax=Symploca sp. SIO1C4 TaxID=2607765 RepID=A0A6B3NBU3_9CYAN|nr:calcium-binding protein [Symploca sp. SIO1C4]
MTKVSFISDSALDNTTHTTLEEATLIAQRYLSAIATDKEFLSKAKIAFGDNFDIDKLEGLRQQWAVGEFEEFPDIEIRSAAEINGANGAFSADTNKIYLSQEYIAHNGSNLQVIVDVLLEEFGHFVDSQINELDAPGDEGEIFLELIQDKTLTETQIQSLKHEQDTATLYLDEKTIEVEQQTGFNIEFDFTYDTNDFFKKFDPSDPLPTKIPDTLKINALDAAANFWEKVINNLGEEFDNIPASLPPGVSEFKLSFDNPSKPNNKLKIDIGSEIDDIRIYVGSVSSFSNPDVLGQGGGTAFEWKYTNKQGKTFGKKIERRLNSKTDFEPFAGSLAFSRSTDWWFDPTPNDLKDSVPKGKFDFVTLAIHEIGHVLGLSLDKIPAFKAEIDGQGRFKGSNAKAVNNGNRIQLTADRHVVGNGKGVVGTNDDSVTDGTKSVMVPKINPGTRLTPQPLDEGMLKDIGYGKKGKLGLNTLIEGLDILLAFQEKIDDVIYNGQGLENGGGLNGLPLFGDQLGLVSTASATAKTSQEITTLAASSVNGSEFIFDLYNKIREGFIEEFADVADATTNEIQNTFLELLGPEGLNLLKDFDKSGEIDKNDINITTENSVIKFNFAVGGLTSFDTELAKNIGLPQLGFQFGDPNSPNSSLPTAAVNLGYTLNFGFGVDTATNEFFFDTSSPEDLSISLKPTLPEAQATVGFLQVDVKDKGSELNFSIDLDDGEDGNNQLTLDELNNLRFTPNGSADIKLNLVSSIPGVAVIPKLVTNLNLHWDFIEGGLAPNVTFENTTLNLGSFLNNFLGPVVENIQQVTTPIQQINDVLNQRIGFLSDLTGKEITLLTLAEVASKFGGNSTQEGFETAKNFSEALDLIDTLTDLSNNAEELEIKLDNFNVSNFDLRNSNASIAEATPISIGEFLESPFEQISQSTSPKHQSFFNIIQENDSGLQFPILENPASAINLFLGQNIDFLKFDPSPVGIKAGLGTEIPIVGPIVARLDGSVEAGIDLEFGFDSEGLQQWADSGFNADKIGNIFNGFFVGDNRENGNDNPEAFLEGSITGSVGGNIIIASAYVGGGISASLFADLEDEGENGSNLGSSDGKIRGSQIIEQITNNNIGCLFEIGGGIDAFLTARARVGWPPFGKKWNKNFARQPLVTFSFDTCDHLDTPAIPILANEGPQKDGNPTQNPDLLLNMGPRAAQRQFVDTNDGAEIFSLKGSQLNTNETVTVIALGYEQNYQGVNKIFADGGQENDVIEVEDIAIPVEFRGGNGDDQLQGGKADDVLKGDKGKDLIDGGQGNDLLYGGEDKDLIDGGQGNDLLYGGEDKDLIDGGQGNDLLYGEDGDDNISGDDGDDRLYGGLNNDSLNGGADADTLYGGAGDDELFGDIGNDLLIGEAGNDQISGGTEVDTVSYQNSPNGVVVNIEEDSSYSNSVSLTDLEPNFFIDAGTALDGFGTQDFFSFTVKKITVDEQENIVDEEDIVISGSLENIIGSQHNDILIGNSLDNRIEALAGNDLLIGNAGNDYLDGGADIDTVSYRRDPGSVEVNLAQNQAKDGFGNTDQIYNVENVIGSAFDDEIIGDANDNTIFAGAGKDKVSGDAGNDTLFGEDGNDTLNGDAGDDYLVGGTGNGWPSDILNGGSGNDTASYITATSGVAASLEQKIGWQGDATGDQFISIENLEGSNFNDFLIGDNGANILSGLDGNDTLEGRDGDDTLNGGEGNNILNAGEGNNTVEAGSGNDTVYAGTGNDNIFTNGGNDEIHAGDGNNTINAGNGTNKIYAGNGYDSISAGTGDDEIYAGDGGSTIFAGAGNNQVYTGNGYDSVEAEDGDDLISVGNGGSNIDAGDGTNTVYAGTGDDQVYTGTGDDEIHVGEGNNNVDAGSGNNIISAGSGNDVIDTGAGDDTIYANEGLNTVRAGDGNNQIYSGSGGDFLFAGTGDDQIYAGEGQNYIDAGNGDNTIYSGSASDFILVGNGNDLIYAGEGSNHISAGNGDNTIYAGAGSDQISTGSGNDLIYAGEGNNLIATGTGFDTVYVGSGFDRFSLSEGLGEVTIYGFQANQDSFIGAGPLDLSISGNDTLVTLNSSGDLLAIVKDLQLV